jgi:hypothetical protein
VLSMANPDLRSTGGLQMRRDCSLNSLGHRYRSEYSIVSVAEHIHLTAGRFHIQLHFVSSLHVAVQPLDHLRWDGATSSNGALQSRAPC